MGNDTNRPGPGCGGRPSSDEYDNAMNDGKPRTMPMPMSEWQPIASAPKDGTGILLYRRYEGKYLHLVDVGQWRKEEEGGPRWAWTYSTWEPTHWMPLPDPPKGGEGNA